VTKVPEETKGAGRNKQLGSALGNKPLNRSNR
jgi:hypothetical protein